MAYTQTINTDQIFVREIFFKDLGNRPISSGKVLVTRGDGGIYFSNVSTSGLYSFSGVQAGNLPTVNATSMSTTLFLGAGPGISYTVSSNIGNSQRIFVNNLGIQQLGVYNDHSIINFSSLTVPTPAGRTLWLKGEGEILIRTSTNTVIIGSAFSSSYSSILYLESTIYNLANEISTNLEYTSTLLGEIIEVASTLNFSTMTADIASLSTFVYTTVADDGTGHHNTLIVSTVRAPYISTTNISTTNITTQNLYIGNTQMFDSTIYTSTNYCTTYVADGPLNAVANSFNIKDKVTNIDTVFSKTAYTNQSTSYGSTFYTYAQQIDFGLSQKYSNAPNLKPITQQIEAINYVRDSHGDATVLKYELKNTLFADEVCTQSTLRVSAKDAIYFSSQSVNANLLNASTLYAENARWRRATGNELTLSTLCVSTIVGNAGPILTFDKTNYRVGVNLGPLMPLATLDVSGVIIANNFVTTSDRRLKQDITVLPLPPYISSYKYKMEGVEDIGVIADEVEAIAPCCVYTRPDGYKAVSYPKLVPILLSYIHDLNARITAIERKI
jgi:hypothetical protein